MNLLLERSKCVAGECSDERAIQLLEDVARSSEDPLKCIAAICLTAHIYTQQLRADKAAQQLESARRWLWEKGRRFSQSVVALCKIHTDFANAFFASTGARPQEAKDLTQVLSAIRQNTCADDDVHELYVDALLFAAEEARSSGEVKAYRECVNAAQSLFSGISEQSARQSTQLIAQRQHWRVKRLPYRSLTSMATRTECSA